MTSKEIANKILSGDVALLPTDTVYGLAANPEYEQAVRKIFRLKNRPYTLNLPIMVADEASLRQLNVKIGLEAQRLLNSQLVPGDLTIIFGFLDKPTKKWLENRCECAVRIPKHEQLLEILQLTGPLLVTSANRHGANSTPTNIPEILADLNGKPDIIVEGGHIENIPSTIVNCNKKPAEIERTGRISFVELEKILKS